MREREIVREGRTGRKRDREERSRTRPVLDVVAGSRVDGGRGLRGPAGGSRCRRGGTAGCSSLGDEASEVKASIQPGSSAGRWLDGWILAGKMVGAEKLGGG